jgi:FtsP/CotA-like multicopper oxidase with cupredoxin domain
MRTFTSWSSIRWLLLVTILSTAGGVLLFRGEALAVGPPSASQVPLDPLTIPKFAHALPIPRTFAPTVITSSGRVVRHEYTISAARTTAQLLPPGFPATTVFAFGGQVKIPGSTATEFVRSTPGPVFENIRGIPSLVRWRNQMADSFMPVDPTLHWANPFAMEPPTFPFVPFPPGYDQAQSLTPLVVHNHGLVVRPDMDGTAEEWFTGSPFIVGPAFVTRDYLKPNDQPATQLFYHDHTMGLTRLNVYAGLVGAAYFIRDPRTVLDGPASPLPKGEFEIPLAVFDRAFFTDGELNFPRVSSNPTANAYW